MDLMPSLALKGEFEQPTRRLQKVFHAHPTDSLDLLIRVDLFRFVGTPPDSLALNDSLGRASLITSGTCIRSFRCIRLNLRAGCKSEQFSVSSVPLW